MGKIKKFDCKCGLSFFTSQGLAIHKSKKEHWVYPKPTGLETRHINFDSLVGGEHHWGQEMTKEQEKHPTDSFLYLGFLDKILRTLTRIEVELKRTKEIK